MTEFEEYLVSQGFVKDNRVEPIGKVSTYYRDFDEFFVLLDGHRKEWRVIKYNDMIIPGMKAERGYTLGLLKGTLKNMNPLSIS